MESHVENETDLKVKYLGSNNGEEHELGEFKKFYGLNGICLERTALATPQQNEIVERINRTLTEHARSMQIRVGLPKCFWADAMHTTRYLINHGPSSSLNFGIPKEVWNDKEVTSHIYLFLIASFMFILVT